MAIATRAPKLSIYDSMRSIYACSIGLTQRPLSFSLAGLIAVLVSGALGCSTDDPCTQPIGQKTFNIRDVVEDLSADGRLMLFAHGTSADGPAGYYVRETGNRDASPRLLVDWPDSPFGIPRECQLTDVGERVVYARPDSGDVFIVDVATGRETRVTFTHGNATSPEWSPDGTQIVYSRLYRSPQHPDTSGIWIVDLPSRIETPLLVDGTPLYGTSLSWSPDGRWIAFSYGSPFAVFVAAVDGSEIVQVSNDTGTGWEPVGWLNEGPTVVFAGRDGGSCKSLGYSMDTRQRQSLEPELNKWGIDSAVSRDGDWFIVTDEDATGRWGVLYRDSFARPGSNREQITKYIP